MVPPWSRLVAEWALLVLVLLLLVWAFDHQIRSVQVQGERAAVQSALGHLRTALVLSRVTAQVGNTHGADQPLPASGGAARNPFLLLEKMPANFAGDHEVGQAHSMTPGTWVFDAECACLGYRLLYPEGLDAPHDAGAIWFRVEGLAGPMQIKAMVPYVWRGQVVN